MAESKKRKLESHTRTRSNSEYYLIGFSIETLSGSRLPTLREVMQYLLFVKECCPRTTPTKHCLNEVVDEVIKLWQMARIPIKQKQNIVLSLGKVYETWSTLLKSKGRTKSDSWKKKDTFCSELDKLWDIGIRDAISVIESDPELSSSQKKEDIAFYEDQRHYRKAWMSGKDKVFARNMNLKTSMIEEQLSEVAGGDSSDEFVALASSSSNQDDSNGSPSEYEIEAQKTTTSGYIMLMAPRNIMENSHITSTVDRLKITDNQATMLLSAFIKVCGGKVKDFVLSRSTTKRYREGRRIQVSHTIMEEFLSNPPQHVAIHWDGKVTEDRLGNRFEALAIVLSHPTFSHGKMLGIQKIQNATGIAQAQATHDMIKNWNIKNAITALVFDTTSSNSGWKNGAAKLLEQCLGKKVLYHACRHHILELVVKEVWKSLFGADTTGPENTMFNKFKKSWKHIDKSGPIRVLSIPDRFAERAASTTVQLKEVLSRKNFLSRDDYKQCVVNTITLLGGDCGIGHQKPGATHHAQWMGTILYAQKMFMWADPMEYSNETKMQLHRMNLFLALFYVPAWVESTIGRDAPGNDLRLILAMHDYKTHDNTVAEAALKKLLKHPWYLVEEIVVFALFTPKEDDDTRMRMALELTKVLRPSSFRRGPPSLTKSIDESTHLADLVGPQSWFLFDVFGCDGSWLKQPVRLWPQSDTYKQMSSFVNTVKVVNDAAERGVKFNLDYATIITDNDEQKASLIQAVEQHRRDYPDFRKSTLALHDDYQ